MAAPIKTSLPAGIKQRLDNSKDTVATLIKTIKASQVASSLAQDGQHPHSRLMEKSQLLSNACTKLVVLFTRPPPPSLDACGVACAKVDQATLSFASAYSLVKPDKLGATYYVEVRLCVLTILEDLEQLLSTIMSKGCTRSASQLHKTGALWKSCESVTRLSKDNLSASLRVYLSQLHLLRDAHSEVKELESSNGVSEDECLDGLDDWDEVTEVTDTLGGVSLGDGGVAGWTDEETKIIAPCIQLISLSVEVTESASRLLVNHGDVSREGGVAQMDCGCGLVRRISPAVDDLASEMPSPVAIETCKSMALTLGDTLMNFVQTLSSHHYCPPNQWPGDKFTDTIKNCLQQLAVT